MTPAGTQGSDARNVRVEGPNLDERIESLPQALFAIRNGGFSGSIMPQNIVTGRDADAVAAFVAKYAGTQEDLQPAARRDHDHAVARRKATPRST